MGLRAIHINKAFGLAIVVGLVAVFLTGRPSDPGNDEPGASSLLQLAGHLGEDESSFMQLSDEVNRRSYGEHRGPGKEHIVAVAASEDDSKVPVAAKPHADGESLLQTGSLATSRVAMSSFVEMGRDGRSFHAAFSKNGDAMMGITIVIFLLCGVALALIFFKLYSEKDDEDEFYSAVPADRYARQSDQRSPLGSSPYAEKSGYNNRDAYVGGRPSGPEGPATAYQRPSPGAPGRQPSPSMGMSAPQSLLPAGPGSPPRGTAEQMLPGSGGSLGSTSSPITPSKLSSELHGAVVPAKRKFVVKVPPLLATFPSNTEISRKYTVYTKDDIEMLNLKVLRHKPNPHESPAVHIEEYMTLSMPPELDKELVVCTFGRVAGAALTCEIYKSDNTAGSKLYGILQEEASEPKMSSGGSTQQFALWLASEPAVKLLSILVVGRVSERKVKILDGRDPRNEVASTVPEGANDRMYQVECYPHSDVLLVVLALAGVDRILANSGVSATSM